MGSATDGSRQAVTEKAKAPASKGACRQGQDGWGICAEMLIAGFTRPLLRACTAEPFAGCGT